LKARDERQEICNGGSEKLTNPGVRGRFLTCHWDFVRARPRDGGGTFDPQHSSNCPSFDRVRDGSDRLSDSAGRDRKRATCDREIGLWIGRLEGSVHGRTAVPHSQPAGIAVTSDRTSVTVADGTNYVGVLAKTRIHIAGLTTKKPVPFQIVTMTRCTDEPHCTALDQQSGVEGILGVGLSGPWKGTPNPLTALPGAYGSSWQIRVGTTVTQISTGQLALGAQMPNGVTTFQLQRRGAYWQDTPPVCWNFASDHARLPTLFDTGSAETTLWSKKVKPIGSHAHPFYAPAGTEVSLKQCGKEPFLSFSPNGLSSISIVRTGPPFAVAGIDTFYNLILTSTSEPAFLQSPRLRTQSMRPGVASSTREVAPGPPVNPRGAAYFDCLRSADVDPNHLRRSDIPLAQCAGRYLLLDRRLAIPGGSRRT
jgi:hypothetical protein